MELSPQQKAFFEAFGYLQFPGVLLDDINWIISEFTAVFTDRSLTHDPSMRTCVPRFIDEREKLCALLDHPVIQGIASGLLGDDFNYTGSDGNYYTGDTGWHPDGFHRDLKHVKLAFYLDVVERESGALRVIPGSHKLDEFGEFTFREAGAASKNWGIEGQDVPSVVLASQPGDLVAFNHNMMHAAFGGSTCRRMFTINLCQHASDEAGVKDLQDFINGGARFWIEEPFGERMLQTAGDERKRHLEQVLENAGMLPELVAKARETMTEPARG